MIYVDRLLHFGWKFYGKPIKSAHLMSDTSLEELHEFAAKIGLKREWFQLKSFPHYDLTPSHYVKAIEAGAKRAATMKEYVDAMNRFRISQKPPIKHHIERTSPKGESFVGTCILCGEVGLGISDATKTVQIQEMLNRMKRW